MRDRVRQLAALAATAVVLAGIPYLLTAVLTWPTLDVSWVTVQVYLRSGRLPPGVFTAALMALLWAVWGLYLLAVAVEALAWLRGHRPRSRPLGPLQVLAATAIGATLATTSAAHAAASSATAPDTAPSAEPDQHRPSHEEESAASKPLDTSNQDGDIQRTRTIDGFDYDDVALTQAMKDALEPTVRLIADHGAAEAPVVITGHTDPHGDSTYNKELSKRRAEAAAQYVRHQLDEKDTPPIETRGVGEAEQIAGGDAHQRRVEITYTISPPPTQKDKETTAPHPTADDPGPQGGDDQQQAIALVLPSGVTLGLAATGAAAAGVAGGYALAARRRQRPWPSGGQPAQRPTSTGPPKASEQATPSPAPDSTTPASPTDGDATATGVDAPVIELLHAPGIGLTGPGAHGAARCLIATALHPTETPASGLRIVIGVDDADLLGEQAHALLAQRHTPTIETVATLDQAMNLVHAEMIARQYRLDEAGVETMAPLRAAGGAQAALEELVVITTPPAEGEADLAGLLGSAADLDVTAVILGRWDTGGTLTISEDGTISDTSAALSRLRGARWPTTSAQALARLLEDLPPAAPAAETEEPAQAPPHTRLAGDRDAASDTPAAEEAQPCSQADDHESPAPASQPPTSPSAGQDEAPVRVRPVRLTLLGRVRITVEGQQVRLRRGHGFELAAYLAAHPGGVRRDAAIEEMWPNEDLRRTTRRFADAVSNLRRLLHPTHGEDAPPVVTRSGDTYHLDDRLVEVDLWDLQAALQAAEHAPAEDRHEYLQQALALYSGDLARSDFPWIVPTATSLRRRLLHTLRDQAAQLRHDRPTEAIRLLHRAIDLDSTDEDTHAALIRLHLHHGDTTAAHHAYQRCVDKLNDINTNPSPHVIELLTTTTQGR